MVKNDGTKSEVGYIEIDLLNSKVEKGEITEEHLSWFNSLTKEERDALSAKN